MRNWLSRLLGGPDAAAAPTDDDARVAAVALLYEVMRADSEQRPEELDALCRRLLERWQLQDADARELVRRARDRAENAVDYHELVRVLREHFDADARAALIDDMWNIAMADGEIDPLEEYVIRKVADLLYVSHHDFIRGKLRHTL